MLADFFSGPCKLKICGVTTEEDLAGLIDLRVDALGLNFWPSSKRYCPPEKARTFSPSSQGKILRVGVFVNNAFPLASDLFKEGVIDVVQLHGDETLSQVTTLLDAQIPVIWAVSATKIPPHLPSSPHFALLLDTPAGSAYGGTGKTFDWTIARTFRHHHPETPVLLAGGLKAENVAEAHAAARPSAVDIASGAEIRPGLKDFAKVRSILTALRK